MPCPGATETFFKVLLRRPPGVVKAGAYGESDVAEAETRRGETVGIVGRRRLVLRCRSCPSSPNRRWSWWQPGSVHTAAGPRRARTDSAPNAEHRSPTCRGGSARRGAPGETRAQADQCQPRGAAVAHAPVATCAAVEAARGDITEAGGGGRSWWSCRDALHGGGRGRRSTRGRCSASAVRRAPDPRRDPISEPSPAEAVSGGERTAATRAAWAPPGVRNRGGRCEGSAKRGEDRSTHAEPGQLGVGQRVAGHAAGADTNVRVVPTGTSVSLDAGRTKNGAASARTRNVATWSGEDVGALDSFLS